MHHAKRLSKHRALSDHSTLSCITQMFITKAHPHDKGFLLKFFSVAALRPHDYGVFGALQWYLLIKVSEWKESGNAAGKVAM